MELTNDILTAAKQGAACAEAHPLVVHIEADAFVVVEKNDGRGNILFATEKPHILQAFMASWKHTYLDDHDAEASPPADTHNPDDKAVAANGWAH